MSDLKKLTDKQIREKVKRLKVQIRTARKANRSDEKLLEEKAELHAEQKRRWLESQKKED